MSRAAPWRRSRRAPGPSRRRRSARGTRRRSCSWISAPRSEAAPRPGAAAAAAPPPRPRMFPWLCRLRMSCRWLRQPGMARTPSASLRHLRWETHRRGRGRPESSRTSGPSAERPAPTPAPSRSSPSPRPPRTHPCGRTLPVPPTRGPRSRRPPRLPRPAGAPPPVGCRCDVPTRAQSQRRGPLRRRKRRWRRRRRRHRGASGGCQPRWRAQRRGQEAAGTRRRPIRSRRGAARTTAVWRLRWRPSTWNPSPRSGSCRAHPRRSCRCGKSASRPRPAERRCRGGGPLTSTAGVACRRSPCRPPCPTRTRFWSEPLSRHPRIRRRRSRMPLQPSPKAVPHLRGSARRQLRQRTPPDPIGPGTQSPLARAAVPFGTQPARGPWLRPRERKSRTT
mmetsp:Transcript_45490/g.145024  ORF Transcript_45490/g.145024 Transcript_45490/m.145024 type:complete len:392 (+) Transcript_45490:255-1430(+)